MFKKPRAEPHFKRFDMAADRRRARLQRTGSLGQAAGSSHSKKVLQVIPFHGFSNLKTGLPNPCLPRRTRLADQLRRRLEDRWRMEMHDKLGRGELMPLQPKFLPPDGGAEAPVRPWSGPYFQSDGRGYRRAV